MSAVIKAINVGRIFKAPKGTIQVLSELTLSVEKGETIAITGASGSGKSTLLQILGCLDRPTAGQVTIAGQDTSKLSDHELASVRNKSIGFVFQFHHLLPEFCAWENVAMPLLVRGQSLIQAEETSRKILNDLGLEERAEHKPNELSGGEQQRVAIARAMVARPLVLLADEPTGNLDRATGQNVAQLLWDLNQKTGIALVIVTHNQEIAQRAPKILELKNGKLWTK
ncbi:ABC transporter ATP-binding protein [candidate division TA06 bacterium]|uniref:ABC transporter ATP-binding protein n=1 Tax=candidate division TA06 bacterium TaxID=2250710 RepID=A0A933MK08_UNCT6|nr:ABC transporter ATP-binding protein [candidate division TA06 bacterium]